MTRVSPGRLASLMIAGSVATASVVLATAAGASVTALSAATAPHIVANPSNLMVNTATHLSGTGFRPDAKLQVMECSQTSWIAPQQPCATGNPVIVRTGPKGAFKASLTAEVCPQVTPPTRRGFREVCYVGVAHRVGTDFFQLVGAVKIIVTGP
jgi:hypothetical protein